MINFNIDLIRGIKGLINVVRRIKQNSFDDRTNELIEKALLYEENEFYEEALALYAEAIVLHKDISKFFTLSAGICYKTGEYSLMKEHLRKAKKRARNNDEWFTIYALELQLHWKDFQLTPSHATYEACNKLLSEIDHEFPGRPLTFANLSLLQLEALTNLSTLNREDCVRINHRSKVYFEIFLSIVAKDIVKNINILDKSIDGLEDYGHLIGSDEEWQDLIKRANMEKDAYIRKQVKKGSNQRSWLHSSTIKVLTILFNLGGIVILDGIDII